MNKVKLGDLLEVKRGTTLSSKYYSKTGSRKRLTLGNFNYPNGGFTAEQITKYSGEGDLAIVKFSPNEQNKHI